MTQSEASLREKFTIQGTSYLAHPSLSELLTDIGVSAANIPKYMKLFKERNIYSTEQLYTFNKDTLNRIGVSKYIAGKIYHHIQLLKRRGPIILDLKDLKEFSASHKYLPFPINSMNNLFSYENGQFGIRSRSILEFFGGPKTGRTTWCMTMAVMCMLPEDKAGWNKGVMYIDAEGSFNYHWFLRFGKMLGLAEEALEEKFLFARLDTLDDIDIVLNQILPTIETKDIGLIIIDPIINPLFSTYPVAEEYLERVSKRFLHLKSTFDRLKFSIFSNNIICIISNSVKKLSDFTEDADDEQEIELPLGGSALAYASDIRIHLQKNTKEINPKSGNAIYKASIESCSYLRPFPVDYSINELGLITDYPENS